MERIDVLIDKLVSQKQQRADTVQMLVTVQLLYKELLYQQQRNIASGSAKVSVVMPNAVNTILPKPQPAEAKEAKVIVEEPAAIGIKMPEPAGQPPMAAEPYQEPYQLKRPVIAETPLPKAQPEYASESLTQTEPLPIAQTPPPKPSPQPQLESQPASKPPSNPNHAPYLPFDPVAETPTLIQHQPKKEVHELVAQPSASLNDKLKQEKTELGQVLKDTPIKDLKKAIGINDRFVFVNELFRGDEAAYERSIKTINNFHILPEAEYWINRELKVKLGWNDSKEVVQHFYQLVRRRFA